MHQDMFNAAIIKKKFKIDKRHSKTMNSLMSAMIKGRSSNLARLSEGIEEGIKILSVYRKLQRFMDAVKLEGEACAEVTMSVLGIQENEQVILVMDRTYWMRGKTHLNFLYLSVYYRGYGIPLFFKMLPDMKGHSSVADRKELVEKFIAKFGKHRIAYIVADREFDGKEWLTYLVTNQIDYVQRLKENIIHMTSSRGEFRQASLLCAHVPASCQEALGVRKIYKTNSFSTNVTIVKSPKNITLLLAHSPGIKDPALAYGTRWAIESGFKAMKTGGFNIEGTGLTKPKRICNLYKLVAMLTAIVLKLGVMIDELLPIKIKTHGRKAVSYLRLAFSILKRPKSSLRPDYSKLQPIFIRLLRSLPFSKYFTFCHVL
jgi:hypothetical protein